MLNNARVGCLLLSVGIVLGVYTFTQESVPEEVAVSVETETVSEITED